MTSWKNEQFRPLNKSIPPSCDTFRSHEGGITNKEVPRFLLYYMVISGLFYVLMCVNIPISISANERYDDWLFFHNAESIFRGDWLGAYGHMTLAKGPGYPIFLALNAMSGIPITLTQSLLYISSCFLLAIVIYRLSTSFWISICSFLILLWDPAMIPVRILRSDISSAQVLFVLACILQFSFLSKTVKQGLKWALLGGIMLGWLWITREDGVWLVPGLFLFFALRVVQLKLLNIKISYFLTLIIYFIVSAAIVWSCIAAINWIKYGDFEEVDFKSASFEHAVQAIQSVRVGRPEAYIPAPNKVLRAIYAASPAFARLKPYFDGPGKGWEAPGCATYPSTCGEIAGGWFIWALRDAVASRGLYHSPEQASDFYDLLTKQINDACATGKLTCRTNIISRFISPFIPAITTSQVRVIPDKLLKLAGLLSWQEATPAAPNSAGDHQQIEAMDKFLNRPLRTPSASHKNSLYASGWFYPDNGKWIQVKCLGGIYNEIITVNRKFSPDIAAHFKNPSANYQRFSINIPSGHYCGIQLTETLHNDHTLKIGDMKAGGTTFGGGTLYFDKIKHLHEKEVNTTAYNVLKYISGTYKAALPPLILVMILIYLWRIILIGKNIVTDKYFLIIGLLLILVATRSAMLLLISISSFPGINTNYMSAGFPLLYLAVVLSIGSLFGDKYQPLENEDMDKL